MPLVLGLPLLAAHGAFRGLAVFVGGLSAGRGDLDRARALA
jgi:hypothetical protein